MKKLFTSIFFLFFYVTVFSQLDITSISWQDRVDIDEDTYTRSRTLRVNITATQATFFYLKITIFPNLYYREPSSGFHFISVGSGYIDIPGIGTSSTGGELNHGTHSFTVEIFNNQNVWFDGVSSNNQKFETAAQDVPEPPQPPSLNTPPNGATQTSTTVNFSWSSPTGAVKYWIQISKVSNFSNLVVSDSNLTTTSVNWNAVAGNNYYWRVKARNNAYQWGNWSSPTWYFIIAPNPPTLISPCGSSLSNTNITFAWNPSDGANKYWIQISKLSNFSNLEVSDSNLTGTSISWNGIAGNTYYWRMKAGRYGSWSNWSGTCNFNITQPQVTITITTSPSGRTITVEGNTYTAPQTFSWTPGTSKSIGTSSPQAGATGTQYVFSNWSDGGAINHSITVPSSSTTYTANFTTQYYLTMSANPSNGGNVNPQSGWHDAGSSVQILASTNSGWYFTSWTGSGSGSYTGSNNPANISMNGPISETANFAPNPTITITTNPSGRTITVEGNTYTAPQTFSWAPGTSKSIGTSSPQAGATGTQYVFSNWSDGGAINHSITVPSSNTTYTANFTTQYYLTMSANPSNGGNVNPQSGWHDAGSSVQILASTNSGWYFTSWTGSGSGSYSGSNNPAQLTSMNGPISETANFSQIPTITITTNPSGRSITVDGNAYTAPQAFNWTPGTSHQIGTNTPQAGTTNTQYIWSNWSDGGAINHSITVPSSNTTYTANFTTQYYLTMSANPSNGGNVSPQSGWHDAGSSVQILANPNNNWDFDGWEGIGVGSYNGLNNPYNIIMNGPISETGKFKVKVGIEDLEFVSNIPTDYSLFNNYPNPFNPSTYIEFGLPEESITQLKVYDILGKEVAVLLDNEIVSAGRFRYELDAKELTSGIYIYVLTAQSTNSKQNFRASKKMSLLK